MSTDMLEDIRNGSQSYSIKNGREARYKICDCFKQSQAEWKGNLLFTRNMGKGLHGLFKAVVNEISPALPIFGESGSEVSYFSPEPINFEEVTRLSEDIKKPWIKAALKDINNSINNQTFFSSRSGKK